MTSLLTGFRTWTKPEAPYNTTDNFMTFRSFLFHTIYSIQLLMNFILFLLHSIALYSNLIHSNLIQFYSFQFNLFNSVLFILLSYRLSFLVLYSNPSYPIPFLL